MTEPLSDAVGVRTAKRPWGTQRQIDQLAYMQNRRAQVLAQRRAELDDISAQLQEVDNEADEWAAVAREQASAIKYLNSQLQATKRFPVHRSQARTSLQDAVLHRLEQLESIIQQQEESEEEPEVQFVRKRKSRAAPAPVVVRPTVEDQVAQALEKLTAERSRALAQIGRAHV